MVELCKRQDLPFIQNTTTAIVHQPSSSDTVQGSVLLPHYSDSCSEIGKQS